MTRLILAAALALASVSAPVAATAQDAGTEEPNLLEEGAEMFFRGLIDEIQPPLEEIAGIGARHLLTLQALTEEMGPAFLEVFEGIDSITYYDPPRILPNGDIVFRRAPDAPPWDPPEEAAPSPEEPAEPERAPDSFWDNLQIDPGNDMEL